MSKVLKEPISVVMPSDTIKVQEPVVVTSLDGKKINGKLNGYSAEKGYVSVQEAGKDIPVTIPLKQVKVMSFPTPASVGEAELEKQKFIVIYKDGSVVRGYTLGHRTDRNGVHLFPTVGPEEYIHTFSAFEGITTYRIADKVGKIPTHAEAKVAEKAQPATPEVTEEGPISFIKQHDQASLDDYLKTQVVVNTEELEYALTRQKSMPNLRIGDILISENLITKEQLDEALEQQKQKRGTPLGEILIDLDYITNEDAQKALAKKLGIPFVNLREFQIEPEIIAMVPRDLAEQHAMMPIAIHEGCLVFAIENPMNLDAQNDIRFHAKKSSEPVMATEEDIKWAIQFYYPSLFDDDASLDELAALDTTDDVALDKEQENVADNVVVKLINKIIMDAYTQNVSDIHIEPNPGRGKTVVRFRKDGTLVNYHELPGQYRNALISRIKIMSHLDISERRKPQDGKIDFKKFGPAKIELRVATIPTAGGMEDVVLRILAAGEPVPIDKLGLSQRNLKNIKKTIVKPYGLFLVCGPTGSGKTTTLHSILGYINTPERKIWTAEDPVEITQKGLRQVQVIPKIGVTFAAAMRSFLRADPDVIMVGEMRDAETTSTGIEASLTGHMVFSTLHTNSAPESVVRLLDMGMDPFNFADALLGIIAQRLAKRLCVDCKEAYTPDDVELYELAQEYCLELHTEDREALIKKTMEEWRQTYANEQGELVLYRPVGCDKCDNSGFRGRVGIHELLLGSDTVKKGIIERIPVAKLNALAIEEGMHTLKQDGIEKVLDGTTDIVHVRAVCVK